MHMHFIADDRVPRQVIPRWRAPVRVTGAEIESHKRKNMPSEVNFPDYERALDLWQRDSSIINAAELIFATVDTPFVQRSIGAIKIALSSGNQYLVDIARNLVSPGQSNDPAQDLDPRSTYYRQISALKYRTREYPLDSISHVELSRLYTNIGQRDHAFRSMEIALNLNARDRFVLRSAARLYVHFREPDRARRLFERLSTRDPWLLSTHVALADVNGWEQRSARFAREILGAKSIAQQHLAELAAAMSTVELKSGNRKLGKKFAQLITRDSNENAIAQLRWIAERFSVEFRPVLLNAKWSYEARSNFDRSIGNWDGCVQNANKWFWDEPFSMRPIHMATFVEAEILGDLSSAQEFCRVALIANEKDATALNNLVYILIMMDKLDEAEEFQSRVQGRGGSAEQATNLATCDMLNFRRGRPDVGRRMYEIAIEELTRLKFRAAALTARMHLLIESMRSRSIGFDEFKKEREEIARQVNATGDMILIAILNNLLIVGGRTFESTFPASQFGMIRNL